MTETHDIFDDVDGTGVFLSAVGGAVVLTFLGPAILDVSGVLPTLGCAAGGAITGGVVYTVAPLVAGISQAIAHGIGKLIGRIGTKQQNKRSRSYWDDIFSKPEKPKKVSIKKQMQINKENKLRNYLQAVVRNDMNNHHCGFYMGPSKETIDKAVVRWEERRQDRKKNLKIRKQLKKTDAIERKRIDKAVEKAMRARVR